MVLLLFIQLVVGVNVAFRVDDIQDYFCYRGQQAVLRAFVSSNTPVTVGIIAKGFGRQKDNVDFFVDIANNKSIEVASHGYEHEDFAWYNLSEQKRLLSLSVSEISNIFRKSEVTAFIPPYFSFNNDTLTAVVSEGI